MAQKRTKFILNKNIIFNNSLTFSVLSATLTQLYISLISSWNLTGITSFSLIISIALATAFTKSSSSGLAKIIIRFGSTSGTPPTFVLTTSNPQQAASTIPIQNASVKLVFKNICPFVKS